MQIQKKCSFKQRKLNEAIYCYQEALHCSLCKKNLANSRNLFDDSKVCFEVRAPELRDKEAVSRSKIFASKVTILQDTWHKLVLLPWNFWTTFALASGET